VLKENYCHLIENSLKVFLKINRKIAVLNKEKLSINFPKKIRLKDKFQEEYNTTYQKKDPKYRKKCCAKMSSVSWASVAHTYKPATQEAEIRRMVIGSQPGQIVLKTPFQKYQHKNGLAE
jgi:hypothetical protein